LKLAMALSAALLAACQGPPPAGALRGALDTVAVTRGPYLQAITPTQVTVRWRVTPPAAGRLSYGTAPGQMGSVMDDPAVATDHSLTLTGLAPGTSYHYTVGTPAQALAGGDAGFPFVTPPAAGSTGATRFWVLGDSGTGNADAARVRDAFLAANGDHPLDVWLMLGDNAYPKGTDEQYQTALFDFFPQLLPSHCLWSAIGNADVLCCEGMASTAPYFRIFSPTMAGEAGGVASGSPLYYSFDHGPVHVVVLDSMLSDRSPGGPMLTWLRKDLDASDKPWLIAAWHHPPYTEGEHDSDFEQAHIQIRENALPILEGHGVDLVLGGHSHSYERSCLLDGHYGKSDTLTPAMKKDPGTGRPEESGPYLKTSAPHQGAVYVVLGNAGQVTPGPLNHPAMVVNAMALGSLVVDIEGNELRANFLRDTGASGDHFVIRKTPAPLPPGCDAPCAADAGTEVGSAPDATVAAGDGGGGAGGSSGCGCTLGGRPAPALALFLVAAFFLRRRRP
jgi:MYXO-CTERM domain-containing protein